MRAKDQVRINRILDSIYFLDQKHRRSLTYIDTKFKVDIKSNGGKFLGTGEIKRKLGDNYLDYEKSKDSVWKIIKKVDDSNTQLLLNLTEKYGFPSKKRLNAYRASAYLIFVHSPRKYHTKIRELIANEYKEERISEYEKAYIFWDLNGRRGMPPRARKDGSVVYGVKPN